MRLLALLVLAGAAGSLAAQADTTRGGVQVRLNGDVFVPPDARDELVVVVRGDARVEGAVRALVVIEGNAVLDGARVEELTVVRGRADLIGPTEVRGGIHLVDADVRVADEASVLGTIERGYGWQMMQGFWILAAVFALGLSIAMLLSGLVAAAVAPHVLREAGAALTDEIGRSAVAAVVIWIGLPVVAVALFATVIGIPTALGFFVFVMPALGFLGYLVTGTRLGDWIVERVRGAREPAHPYFAALIGLGILLVLAQMPVFGGIVTPLAGIVGAGAIGLVAWRRVRRPPGAAAPAEPEPVPELSGV